MGQGFVMIPQIIRRLRFSRTIGIASVRIIGMANVAYNFQRLAWLEGRGVPA